MTDLFTDENNDQLNIDPNKKYFEELVGDGKKFKTTEDLAKGKYLADRMIELKNAEFDKLREDFNKVRDENNAGAKLQELIDQLKEQQLASRDDTMNSNEDNKPAYDPKQVEDLIESKMTQREINRRESENVNFVKNKLIERFGTNFQSVINDHLERLDLPKDYVNDLAKKHPTAVFRLLGVDQDPRSPGFEPPPRSQQRNDSFAPKSQKRNWAFYEDLRVKDPSAYYNSKTQVQLIKDAEELGDDFER